MGRCTDRTETHAVFLLLESVHCAECGNFKCPLYKVSVFLFVSLVSDTHKRLKHTLEPIVWYKPTREGGGAPRRNKQL